MQNAADLVKFDYGARETNPFTSKHVQLTQAPRSALCDPVDSLVYPAAADEAVAVVEGGGLAGRYGRLHLLESDADGRSAAGDRRYLCCLSLVPGPDLRIERRWPFRLEAVRPNGIAGGEFAADIVFFPADQHSVRGRVDTDDVSWAAERDR